MIRILERYIAKTTIVSIAMTALIVTGILFLMMLLREIKNIGIGDYDVAQVFFYVLMRLPNELYQFSPMFLLLGSIVGLSILSGYRELAVMRASGFSTRRIMMSVLGGAFLLVLLMTLIGEWFAPRLSYEAEIRKEIAKNNGQAVVTASGVWFHVDNNFIHVQQVVKRQLLEGVTRYQFDDRHRLQAAYYAKTLTFQEDKWTMNEVTKTTFYPERVKTQFLPTAEWNLKFNPNLLNIGLVDPNEMSLSKLAKFVVYLKRNGSQASEYQYNFWQRLFQPMASLIMIFLAIPFVLGTQQTATMGWRVLMGSFIGLVFFLLNALLGQLCIVYQIPAMFAAALPLALFAIIGIILSNRLIRQ